MIAAVVTQPSLGHNIRYYEAINRIHGYFQKRGRLPALTIDKSSIQDIAINRYRYANYVFFVDQEIFPDKPPYYDNNTTILAQLFHEYRRMGWDFLIVVNDLGMITDRLGIQPWIEKVCPIERSEELVDSICSKNNLEAVRVE